MKKDILKIDLSNYLQDQTSWKKNRQAKIQKMIWKI